MIFNQNILKLHREFAIKNIHDSDFLIEHAACDIIENIELLNIQPQSMLEIGRRAGNLSRKLAIQFPNAELTYAAENTISDKQCDLVVSCMYFHWINEVEKFLRHIHSILTDSGKLVVNFVSSGSLENLKLFLLQCELEAGVGHSPHIMPFPKEEKVQTMFQQCGFKFVVVSTEKIELEYEGPIRLMKDLKNMGENNALMGSSGILPRNVFTRNTGTFQDMINLVTVVAGKTG